MAKVSIISKEKIPGLSAHMRIAVIFFSYSFQKALKTQNSRLSESKLHITLTLVEKTFSEQSVSSIFTFPIHNITNLSTFPGSDCRSSVFAISITAEEVSCWIKIITKLDLILHFIYP